MDMWKAAFVEVEGLSDALGDCLDPNMPDSSVSVLGKDVTGKLQAAAVKTNKKAMAYLELAFDNMKLLRLVTKVKSDEWLEGEAWKAMQFLTKKYHPNNLQERVELRKRLVNLKLRFDQDPSYLLEELVAIKHASVQTKAKVTEIDLIGAVYAAAPMEYEFTGYCYMCKEKGTGLLIVIVKKRRNQKQVVLEGVLMETATNVGAKGTRKVSVGKFQKMRTRDLLDINRKLSMDMRQLAVVQE